MTTSVNAIVTEIWCEILGLEGTPESESFFELGGTSIEAEHIASRVSQALAVHMEGVDILRYELLPAVIATVRKRMKSTAG